MTTPPADWFARCRQFAIRPEWKLTEHFFRALFDFGILSHAGADSFGRMLLGVIGLFVSAGLLITRMYAGKYVLLSRMSSEAYRRAVLGDDLMLVGLPMLLIAFVILTISHSLFPDERDFRVLGPLPVRRSTVFGAKLAALTLFTGLFLAVIHVSLLPLMLLTSAGDRAIVSRLAVWVITSLGGSMCVVLGVTALVGMFMLALSRRRFHQLTGVITSIMLALLVLCAPLALRLPNIGGDLAEGVAWLALVPPAWFVGLQQVLRGSDDPWFFQLGSLAIAAVCAAAAIVAVAYALLFRRFECLFLYPAITSSWRSNTRRTGAFVRATPAFRAVHRFTVLTLRRSQLHQSVLVGLGACGVGMAMSRLIEANIAGWWRTGASPSSSLVGVAMWMPFGLMLVCGLSIRAALVLPIEHRANWIFRLTEHEATRHEQLRAVDQVVTTYVVGVPVLMAIPVLWMALGTTAVTAAAVAALVGLVFVHGVLLDWRRVPFTCSYLPGKRFIARNLVLGCFVYLLFTFMGTELVQAAVSSSRQAVAIAAVLSVIAYALKRRRLATWRKTPLMFEDEFPDQPQRLFL